MKNYSLTMLLGASLALPWVTAAPVDAAPVWTDVSTSLEKRQAISGQNTPFTVPRGSIVPLWDNLETVIPVDSISGPLTIEAYLQVTSLTPPTVYNNTNIIFTNSGTPGAGLSILHISFRSPSLGVSISSRFGNPPAFQGQEYTPFTAFEASWETSKYTDERLIRFTIEPVTGSPGSGRRYRFTFAPTRSSADNLVHTYTVPAGFPTATKANFIYYADNAQPRLSNEIHVGYGVPLNA